MATTFRSRDKPPNPAIFLPWVPVETRRAADAFVGRAGRLRPNPARFLEAVHTLGGWEAMSDNFMRLLDRADRKETGWLREMVDDGLDAAAAPLRHAAVSLLDREGYTRWPYWPHRHQLELRLYARFRWWSTGHETGRGGIIPSISAARLLPAAHTALRGILWARDSQVVQVRAVAIRGSDKLACDAWTVSVAPVRPGKVPAWAIQAPPGALTGPG